MKHNAKYVLMNQDVNTSGVTTITGTVDTLGFRYASITFAAATTNGAHTTISNHAVEQSDASGSGFAAISGFTAGTDWTPSSAAVATNVAKVVYNIDLRGRKRYLKVTFGSPATNIGGVLSAVLTNAENGVATAAEQGAAFTVNG